MKILFVGLTESIHAARWINQLTHTTWERHFFSANDRSVHPALQQATVHGLFVSRIRSHPSVRFAGNWPLIYGRGLARSLIQRIAPPLIDPAYRLARVIKAVKPDIIHSLGLQHGGYLALAARRLLPDARQFPPWIVSIWGSDIYLFGQLAEHTKRVQSVLAACSYIIPDCERDQHLAWKLGFQGEFPGVMTGFGSIDLSLASSLRQPGMPSSRRVVALKGYQNWAGRALVGLRALELCADALSGYRIAIYSASYDVRVAAEVFVRQTGIPIDIVPSSSVTQMLQLHGSARISLGLSLSDGMPASMLEAMAMGSFPIQSCSSCADEWTRDGETSLLVNCNDPYEVAAALRRALTDNELVDRAAVLNRACITNRLNPDRLTAQVVAMYEDIASRRRT